MPEEFDHDLEKSIYDTIKFFDVFRMPITTTQIWRALIVDREGSGVRWRDYHVPALRDVKRELNNSVWLKDRVVTQWGYYCLASSAGREEGQVQGYVRARLMRHAMAQEKWKITRRVTRLLAPLPFVRMIGGSGSLALYNTREASDLDLFIIVKAGRIWTARLFLLLVTQLTGRRRKYWDEEAPDKVCLNHYVTDVGMVMASSNRNLYTAHLYNNMVLLYGMDVYEKWMAQNETWIKRWLMYPSVKWLKPREAVKVSWLLIVVKGWVEGLLLEPIGGFLERWVELVQRKAVVAHTKPGQVGRVVLGDNELAFHPDTQAPSVLNSFLQEEGPGFLV